MLISFHNLSWITEINELFHDILIYWDAPVYWISLVPVMIYARLFTEKCVTVESCNIMIRLNKKKDIYYNQFRLNVLNISTRH